MDQSLVLSNSGFPVPCSGFASLLQHAYAQPVLSEEEERELAERLQRDNDLKAAQRLILCNLRFVLKIAKDYTGYGLPLEDIAQEGTVGLMKAVKRFDPSRGVRLISFAVSWIRAEIFEFVLKNWRVVKVATTKAQRKLFFKLRQCKKSLNWLSEEQVEYIADQLNVRPEDVAEMEKRLAAHDAAFDPVCEAGDDGSESLAPRDVLFQPDQDPVKLLEHQESSHLQITALREGLAQLNERSRDIIERRWLLEPKATLEELADDWGVSKERIRQIEKAAMDKIGKQLVCLAA